MFFKFIDADDWEYRKTEDLVTVAGASDLVFAAPSPNNFLYKANF